MIGTVPYAPGYKMNDLADVLTENENWSLAQLTSIVASANPPSNLCSFARLPLSAGTLGNLAIVAHGGPSAGTLLFTASIYVENAIHSVDVYRLAPPATQ